MCESQRHFPISLNHVTAGEGTHNVRSRLPLSRLGKIVERSDEREQARDRRLSEARVVVIEQADEDLGRPLNVREERLAGRGEEVSNHVGGDLLCDGGGSGLLSEELLELVLLLKLVDVFEVVVVVIGSVVLVGEVGGVDCLGGGSGDGVW